MSSTRPPSLLVRTATLTLALGTLTGLVVHTSMAAGCNSSGGTTAPTATPDPASAPSPTSASPTGQASAAPAPSASSGSVIKPGIEYFPASKSGRVFRAEEVSPPPQVAPSQNSAPPAGQVR